MTELRTLTTSDFDALLVAFNDAFSDYVIKLTLTREQLAEMLRRRGWIPEASIAAFEGERIVAFTLNAVESERAYDTGTGVVVSHRRQGLARQVMEASIARVRELGATHYLLEVIDNNAPAVALYRALGFVETRGLQCWMFDGREAHARTIEDPDWDVLHAMRDVEPSWQNSTASLLRAGDRFELLGDGRTCYAAVFPATGDLPQLAVARDHRRRGTGRRLLGAALERAGRPLRIINVDERDAGIAAFLTACGAKKTVRQLEMVLPL